MPELPKVRLILASASPRRRDLLRAAGYAFEVEPADVDERQRAAEAPVDYVRRLAAEKSATVARRCSGDLVLAADTAVVIDDRILGKPADRREAAQMLEILAGRTHEVLTAVSLRMAARQVSAVEATQVRFLPIGSEEIAWYVASGEPVGKAGGYAIQGLGSRFVDWIEGSYGAVVGLPVATVYRLIRELQVEIV